jgi:hypothetical protein
MDAKRVVVVAAGYGCLYLMNSKAFATIFPSCA